MVVQNAEDGVASFAVYVQIAGLCLFDTVLFNFVLEIHGLLLSSVTSGVSGTYMALTHLHTNHLR
ncbi:hypothetical protein BJX96DRAFT_101623 [Aspergillus floccosus]